MTEEELRNNREFVEELIRELFDVGNFNHLDGYAGALLVLDIEEATEALRKKGWDISRKKGSDGE